MFIIMNHIYKDIISIENLCLAWREFVRGKKLRNDVAEFSLNLSENIFQLNKELSDKTYCHGSYEKFSINDPKPRSIHKATVRDRLIHHAVYRILYLYFNNKFIHDSYSCRLNKGTHRALSRFNKFAHKISKSNSRSCWILKCDIRKFFASIDHQVLLGILEEYIVDKDTLWLLENIIKSFETKTNKGLPLGNLTSQLLVNIYHE